MNKIFLSYLSGALLLVAAVSVANHKHTYQTTTKTKTHSETTAPGKDRDNTAVNERDRADHELTAGQQGMNSEDTNITAAIRQDLMKDDSLSTYAKNIKIITENGKITLKGPVNSQEEKNKVLAAANRNSGSHPIDDNIDVVQR